MSRWNRWIARWDRVVAGLGASERRRRWRGRAAIALLIVLACGVVRSTSPRIAQTADEPNHLAVGLEWWQRGTYLIDSENPPLARIAIALGPAMAGLRPGPGDAWQSGTAALYDSGDAQGALGLARAGVLPFFAALLLVTFAWARWCGGARAGVIALAALATVPPVLAHAGLATTDLPHAAMLLWALYACLRWASEPDWPRAAWLGLAVGAAFATKLSTVGFLPAGLVAIALVPAATRVVAALRRRREAEKPAAPAARSWPRRIGMLAVAAAIAALAVWATYRFSFGRAIDQPQIGEHLGTCAAAGSATRGALDWLTRLRLPAPSLLHGLIWVCAHNHNGHPSYLLGDVAAHGHRAFYLIAIAIKTPLPFLLASVAAIASLIARARRQARPLLLAAPLAAAGIVAMASMADIHIGLRHVLIAYPLLAIAIGVAASAWLDADGRRGAIARAVIAGFVIVELATAVLAYPQYLSYFNPIAGDEPGTILVDSDLDWGQGLIGLREALADQQVDQLHLAYFGTARPCAAGLPPLRWLAPDQRPTGWIAISEAYFRGLRPRMYRDPCDPSSAYGVSAEALRGYQWLAAYRPWARVGGIRIYHVPAP